MKRKRNVKKKDPPRPRRILYQCHNNDQSEMSEEETDITFKVHRDKIVKDTKHKKKAKSNIIFLIFCFVTISMLFVFITVYYLSQGNDRLTIDVGVQLHSSKLLIGR